MEKKDKQNVLAEIRIIYENAECDFENEYIKKKKISGTTIRYSSRGGFLLVPMYDIRGNLMTLQKIFDDGKKMFWKGGEVKSAFHPIGNVHSSERLLICEGYATGDTLHSKTGYPVVCAMSAGNLLSVARAFRSAQLEREIVICGDNDRASEKNIGKAKAESAALDINAKLALPVFVNNIEGTDFNDMLSEIEED